MNCSYNASHVTTRRCSLEYYDCYFIFLKSIVLIFQWYFSTFFFCTIKGCNISFISRISIYSSPSFFRLLVWFTFAVTSQMRGLCAISYLEQVVNICHSPDKFLRKNEIFGSSLTQISRVNIERLFKERRKKEKRLKTFQIISCSAVFALTYWNEFS